MTTEFRYRANAASETKYSTPLIGMTPSVKSANCPGSDNACDSPRNPLARLSPTNGTIPNRPAIASPSSGRYTGTAHRMTPSTNATVGLLVSDDANRPTANSADPASQYPRYVVRISPQSGLPIHASTSACVMLNSSATV